MSRRQRGAATLFVTVTMLALLTIVAVVATKVGMLELKTAANTNRAKESFHAAQGGLDYGAVRYLADSTWSGETITMPYGGGGASVSVSATAGSNSVVIQATGESVDGTGLSKIEEKYTRLPVVDFGELPPLMSNGNFPPSGSFSVVANPDGGGTGVPVSAWVDASVTTGVASWQTCNLDEFLYEGNNASQTKVTQSDGFVRCDTCRCQQADNKLCEATNGVNPGSCDDIVVQSGLIDVFKNTFGVEPSGDTDGNGRDAWEDYLRAIAKTDVACADLNSTVGDRFYTGADAGDLPLIWIEGNCSIPAGTQVGSYDAPIILLVHGNLTMNSNSRFFGVLFDFSDTYGPNAPSAENFNITINGSPVVYGVILVNADIDLPTGSFTLVYSQNILEKLSNKDETFYELARFPGSWTDTK